MAERLSTNCESPVHLQHLSSHSANNINPADNNRTVNLPPVSTEDNYTLTFGNITNINNVFATSGSFSIGAAVSSSSGRSTMGTSGSVTQSGSASQASATSPAVSRAGSPSASNSGSRPSPSPTGNAPAGLHTPVVALSGTCTQFASDHGAQCISFTGSNLFWNDDISSIEVYSGHICDFYVDAGCIGARQFMPTGVYNTIDYNDQYTLHSDPSAAQGAPEASRPSATNPRADIVRRGLPTCWISTKIHF
ncbi:hypothetical protein B0H14DRAFT_3453340 [Mycena olivaceomarginata]|nr:hypothetical protein B0H14DRAFT_3453340 [Mycena olivaceomarginata]